jgi:hypothetical protein
MSSSPAEPALPAPAQNPSPGSLLHFSLPGLGAACKSIGGRVVCETGGIAIALDGYGNCAMEPGHASVVYLEADESGHPVLYVWADFRQEEPTHKISLSPAREQPVAPSL